MLMADGQLPMEMTMNTLPDEYRNLSDDEMFARIRAAKEKLGSDAVILGHHYQREEVIQFADYRGDSLELSTLSSAGWISWPRQRPCSATLPRPCSCPR
jgi:quinolinate synthase